MPRVQTIKVLGPGCANCERLTRLTEQVLADLGREAQIEKVTDYAQIAAHGVMATPALVVDGVVVLAGSVPSEATLRELLS
ncbi:MAG: thioredoxin family protein [Gaiellaceae bacterium]